MVQTIEVIYKDNVLKTINPEITGLIKKLKESLQKIYRENLYELYLYGSYARNNEDPESDIDIAIILKDFSDYWEEIKRTGSIISSLSLEYDVTISPVRIRKEDWLKEDTPFLKNLKKEAILI
ncbi:MAG: nucleotidyltransferase domain-containing protein [Candidatus Eremiobacterota bacterium]